MKKIRKCATCGEEFEYESSSQYPRKYCDKCSKKRKEMWENQWEVKFEDLEDDED